MATFAERRDPEKLVERDSSSDEVQHGGPQPGGAQKGSGIRRLSLVSQSSARAAAERSLSLHDLPDPDEGKSEEEKSKIDKALMWKVDKWLIPWLSLLYLLSFLDRTNIGNARLAGLEKDIGMSGKDYNLSLTIFFISYALAEPLTGPLIKRLTPRVYFTAIILSWGLIMTLMGLVTNFAGLLAARFFLGLAEAGLFPGMLSFFHVQYTRI
jgi:Major Facilitator Superfamily